MRSRIALILAVVLIFSTISIFRKIHCVLKKRKHKNYYCSNIQTFKDKALSFDTN